MISSGAMGSWKKVQTHPGGNYFDRDDTTVDEESICPYSYFKVVFRKSACAFGQEPMSLVSVDPPSTN